MGQGEETVDTSFFITEENLEKLEKARETNSVEVNLRLHSQKFFTPVPISRIVVVLCTTLTSGTIHSNPRNWTEVMACQASYKCHSAYVSCPQYMSIYVQCGISSLMGSWWEGIFFCCSWISPQTTRMRVSKCTATGMTTHTRKAIPD